LLGVEVGKRNGYLKAYISLVKSYDRGYIARWKELREKEHKVSDLTQSEAYTNVQKSLRGLDFPINVELTDEDE